MSDIDSRIEALAELGIHRVGDTVFEKTHLDTTRKWVSATLEDVLDAVESDLAKFPGIFGHTISRSDQTHETVDLLRAQAAPAEEPAPEAPAAETAVDPSGVTADAPGETATGRVGTEADVPTPEQASAPEGATQS